MSFWTNKVRDYITGVSREAEQCVTHGTHTDTHGTHTDTHSTHTDTYGTHMHIKYNYTPTEEHDIHTSHMCNTDIT